MEDAIWLAPHLICGKGAVGKNSISPRDTEGNAVIAAAVENNSERALDVYLILTTLNGEDIDDAVGGVGDFGKEHAQIYRKETIPAGYKTALAYSIYGEYFDIDEIDSVGFSLEIREEKTNSVIKEDNIIYNY